MRHWIRRIVFVPFLLTVGLIIYFLIWLYDPKIADEEAESAWDVVWNGGKS